MGRAIRIGLEAIIVLALIGVGYWYYGLDGSVPEATDQRLDIAAWRELIRDDTPQLPTDIRVEFIGRDLIPFAAVEAGGVWAPFTMARTAFQVNGAVGSVIIDTGMDKEIARAFERDGQSNYDEKAYGRVIAAMGHAVRVAVTNEHADHIGGVARHPNAEALATRLALTRTQLDGLAKHAPGGVMPAAFAGVEPIAHDGPQRVAPGIVMIPADGHTPGSVMYFIRMWGGREVLFIGDIAWSVSNVRTPAVRPRLMQDFLMSPPEDRSRVSAQVRALHELTKAERNLTVVPSHDEGHLLRLIEAGIFRERFVAPVTP